MVVALWQAHITMIFKAFSQGVEISRTIGQCSRQPVDVAIVKAEESRNKYSVMNLQVGSTGRFGALYVLRLNSTAAFAHPIGYH